MDVLVTVPQAFGLDTWVDEGQWPGEPWNHEEYDFYLYGPKPDISPGERVYIVYGGKLRGYAPLIRIGSGRHGPRSFSLVRHGDAVACTIDRYIKGFRGWRYRDWDYGDERPFPAWMIA